MMTTGTQQAVLESYHRCEASGGFFDTFYQVFFATSPEIPPKFANTNMERQKQEVMASVLMALRLGTGDPVARRYVEELGESHSRRGHDIRPGLYALWLDALCQAVRRHDPHYTPELDAQWRQEMRPAIEMMSAAY
jgi:hemoglobin-like flavoprotein